MYHISAQFLLIICFLSFKLLTVLPISIQGRVYRTCWTTRKLIGVIIMITAVHCYMSLWTLIHVFALHWLQYTKFFDVRLIIFTVLMFLYNTSFFRPFSKCFTQLLLSSSSSSSLSLLSYSFNSSIHMVLLQILLELWMHMTKY